MKSRRRQNSRAAARQLTATGRSKVQNVPVRRYSHPISTRSPVRQVPTAEELLSSIQESLARQAELLEELLRRTEGYSSDAK